MFLLVIFRWNLTIETVSYCLVNHHVHTGKPAKLCTKDMFYLCHPKVSQLVSCLNVLLQAFW